MRDTFRGIFEGYFDENVFVPGQSSASCDMKCKEWSNLRTENFDKN